jgi:Coenzyme PQQ synthesis protein D (PqqD)
VLEALGVVTKEGLLPKPSESAIFRALPEGGVLFSTESEVYFGVNMVGARIWELLPPATSTFDELCGMLFSEYSDVGQDVIRNDARKFLDQLLSNGLVIPLRPEVASSDASRA